MRPVETTAFYRRDLPHWEIEGGRYFVTFRCADSLPQRTVSRLRALHETIDARASAEEKTAVRREYFRVLDLDLDRSHGACLLRDGRAAQIVVQEFEALSEWNVAVPHFTVMPNHCHALIEPARGCAHSFRDIMKRLKGRTAHQIRAAIGGSGRLWQREWFDRWMRDEVERARTIAYIRNNPVKAGLVQRWEDHPWTR
jgi:putative transposase